MRPCRARPRARACGLAALTLLALASAPCAAGAAPAAPAPAEYGREPAAAPTALEARVLAAVRGRLRPAPGTSPSLVLAARELAARAASGTHDPIGRTALRGALARALAGDPAPAAVLVSAATEEAPETVVRALTRRSATHAGAGAFERDGRAWVVVLLSERRITLEPFPRDVAAGGRAVLSGALGRGLSRARVFVTRPAGEVVEGGAGSGSAFRATLEFPSRGRHVVEVVAEGDAGPEVVAILVVAAGGAALDGAPRAAAPPEPANSAASEAGVLAALNAARARRGLPPVVAAPAAAAVARRHAEAMAAAGRVAHLLPGSPDAGTRLKRADVPFRRAYENVARAATALDAHAAVEESPAHLANVLRPGATRAGIGIARARLPSGDATVYLCEILLEPTDDGATSRLTPDARIREALWGERARLGLAPLTADPGLDALAREAASAMARRDEPQPDGIADRALALRRQLAAVDVFVAGGPEDAGRSANLKDARFARVGVGVVSGDSARYGKARLWIAVIYTD
jgi:uncharacterized protein YkwD